MHERPGFLRCKFRQGDKQDRSEKVIHEFFCVGRSTDKKNRRDMNHTHGIGREMIMMGSIRVVGV